MSEQPQELPELCQYAVIWRNRFTRLLDRSPVPTALSRPDGVLVSVNPAFASLWGARPGQLTGRVLLELLTPTDPEPLCREIRDALRRGRRSRYPFRVRWTAGGVTRSGRITVEPTNDELIDPPPLVTFLHADAPRTAEPTPPVALTAREARILALAAAGATTSVIARTVGVTADGVSYHVARLCTRLGAPNRTALVARAYVLGLLDPAAWPPEPRLPS